MMLQDYIAQFILAPEVCLLKQQTTSTNDDLIQLIQQSPHIQSALICSEQQTQGRGQHQREWLSPQGNIYMSCLAQLQRPLDGRFALEVGLNILNINLLSNYPLKIKWANDLYSDLGKWGGILIEPINEHTMIVGVGVNLYPLIARHRKHIQQPCTSLSELNIPFQRDYLIADLYIAIQNAVQWFNYGSKNLQQRFAHHAFLIGQFIHFEHQHQIYYGQYQGINADGAFILDTDTQQHIFYSGRIILNP